MVLGIRPCPPGSAMLQQEELAFLKAISTLKLSPAIRQELRKALAARRRTTAVAAAKKKGLSVPTSRCQDG